MVVGCQPYAPAAFTHKEILLVLISVRGCVDPRAIVRPEGFYVNEKFQWHSSGIEPAIMENSKRYVHTRLYDEKYMHNLFSS